MASEATTEIAPATRVGAVHLSVADLDRSVAYYEGAIGLRVLERLGDRATLGAGDRELLVLVEEPGARPAFGHTGLFHFALLLPERRDLAAWLAHASRDRVALTGASDHFVSEALYLRDPDAHGIEIYWDRDRSRWEGVVDQRLVSDPLDLEDILRELDDPSTEPFTGMPDGTVMGHVHLRVREIPETIAFYRDVLGFGLMAQMGDQAAFLSAGGYHHHLGANTWESAGGSPPPPGSAALRFATILLPDDAERSRVLARVEQSGGTPRDSDLGPMVADPSGNWLLLSE